MGGWQLEVAKMAIYMAFPVGIFHYFNQPKFFEDWVISVKRELYPIENPEHRAMYEKLVVDKRKDEEQKLLKALEKK